MKTNPFNPVEPEHYPFKVGDWVECINDETNLYIKKGHVYQVGAVSLGHVALRGRRDWYLMTRFKLTKSFSVIDVTEYILAERDVV